MDISRTKLLECHSFLGEDTLVLKLPIVLKVTLIKRLRQRVPDSFFNQCWSVCSFTVSSTEGCNDKSFNQLVKQQKISLSHSSCKNTKNVMLPAPEM